MRDFVARLAVTGVDLETVQVFLSESLLSGSL